MLIGMSTYIDYIYVIIWSLWILFFYMFAHSVQRKNLIIMMIYVLVIYSCMHIYDRTNLLFASLNLLFCLVTLWKFYR